MDDGEHAADHQGENGDHLCATRDGTAPSGVGKAQNGRNQRAGVADANPKDKVGNGEGPEDRPIDTPDTDSFPELVCECANRRQHYRAKNDKNQPEASRRMNYWTQQVMIDLVDRFHRLVVFAMPGILLEV